MLLGETYERDRILGFDGKNVFSPEGEGADESN